MADATSLDYTKIIPLLPSILKLVQQAETEQEKKLLMDVLVQDALRRTTSEIANEQRRLQEKNASSNAATPGSDKDGTRNATMADEDKDDDDEKPATSIFSDDSRLSLQKIGVFLKKYSGLEPLIEQLFIESDGKVERIYSSLKTSKKSEAQRRVILLQCLANAIMTGKFSAMVETVKQECKDFGIYESNLFTTYLKRDEEFFKSSDRSEQIELNEKGQLALAETLRAMSAEG
jgi:hypothetical protein